jgi:isopenicillin N synthase-like dioxygenase
VAASIGVETPPDLCELLCMNRLGEPGVGDRSRLGDAAAGLMTPNVWPANPPLLRATWLDYYAAMEALATDLMRLFALGLALPEKFFDDKIDDHMTNMCANYYYPQAEPPLPGQLRKGPHTDWGSLTVLYQDDAGGLQVQHPSGGWQPVAFVPGSFVINLGDLMAHWTGGQWVSTMHRVLNPPPPRRTAHRVSIAFFHQPNYDAVIEPLSPVHTAAGGEQITSGGWIARKLAAAYG